MLDKIQDIMKWYDQFNGYSIKLQTSSREIEIDILNSQLPHLLGMQYTQPEHRKIGMSLYNEIAKLTDEQIFSKIKTNNPDKLEFVQDRIKTFEYFMKNLEKAVYVENTHPNTKIKSGHFLLETEDKRHMHLGLLSVPQGDIPTSFDVFSKEEVEKAKFETYTIISLNCGYKQFVRYTNFYGRKIYITILLLNNSIKKGIPPL